MKVPSPFSAEKTGKMNIRLIIAFLGAVSYFCGCSRQEQEPDVIHIRTGDAGSKLVEIGDVAKVTCGDVRSRIEFERGLWKIRNAKMSAAEQEARLAAFTEKRFEYILPEVIHQKMVGILSKEKKVALTAEEEEAEVKRMLAAFRFTGGIEKFAAAVGCDVEYAKEQLCVSALMKKIREAEDAEVKVVTEKEVDEGLQRLSDYYDRAVASNRVTWTTCSNVLQQINEGLDFAKAGEMYGYNNGSEGERWGSFEKGELDTPAIQDWAFEAPRGAMKIFELGDGISIVKVIGTENRTNSMAEVELARINFAMVEPEPEPRTRDYVRSALLKWKAENVQKSLFEKASEKYPIKFLHKKAQMVY